MDTRLKLLTLTTALMLSGCATKNNNINTNIREIVPYEETQAQSVKLEPYQIRIKPIVGSRQNDSKVIVDQGVVLKIWIAPYKVKNTLIASHDIYTWARKPQFIVGEDMPKYNSRMNGLFRADGKLPFIFGDSEIQEYKPIEDKQIKKYVNTLYAIRSGKKVKVKKTLDSEKVNNFKDNNLSKIDTEILNFLNEHKKEGGR